VQLGLDLVFLRAARCVFLSSYTNPSIIRNLKPLRGSSLAQFQHPIRITVPGEFRNTHRGRCLPNHTLAVRGDLCAASVTSRLLAGGASR
jgi:hypothetical protein